MTYLHVLVRSASPKGRAKHYARAYRKMALVETTTPEAPARIDVRLKTVVRVHHCDTVHWGKGKRSEGAKYLEYLHKRLRELETPEQCAYRVAGLLAE